MSRIPHCSCQPKKYIEKNSKILLTITCADPHRRPHRTHKLNKSHKATQGLALHDGGTTALCWCKVRRCCKHINYGKMNIAAWSYAENGHSPSGKNLRFSAFVCLFVFNKYWSFFTHEERNSWDLSGYFISKISLASALKLFSYNMQN